MTLGPGEPAAGPWRVERFADVVARLLVAAGDPVGRPRVVAVDGRAGGGKTTVSGRLHASVPSSVVVHTDDVAWYESFFGWAELLVAGVLEPVHRGAAAVFRPPAWDRRSRPGAIEVPAGLDLLIVEGVGAARRELMPFVDAVMWVQSDITESDRRGIERDGGDRAAADFWYRWQAEELPFLADQRAWDRAAVIVCGTPSLPHGPDEIVTAPPFRADPAEVAPSGAAENHGRRTTEGAP